MSRILTAYRKTSEIILNRNSRSYLCRYGRRFSVQSLDVNTNVAKDVILFKYENPRYFRILNIFGIAQFMFWSYMSVFSFTSLRNTPVEQSNNEVPWWRKINLGEEKYRNTLAIVSFVIGYGILVVTWSYTLKSVRYLILHQGGQNLSFVTYTPFGQNRITTIPLKYVSCKEARNVAKNHVPLKVKNHYLHYLLDMRGEFKNPVLFDHTAGVYRKWRTAV